VQDNSCLLHSSAPSDSISRPAFPLRSNTLRSPPGHPITHSTCGVQPHLGHSRSHHVMVAITHLGLASERRLASPTNLPTTSPSSPHGPIETLRGAMTRSNSRIGSRDEDLPRLMSDLCTDTLHRSTLEVGWKYSLSKSPDWSAPVCRRQQLWSPAEG
jgi:hypothetical protein